MTRTKLDTETRASKFVAIPGSKCIFCVALVLELCTATTTPEFLHRREIRVTSIGLTQKAESRRARLTATLDVQAANTTVLVKDALDLFAAHVAWEVTWREIGGSFDWSAGRPHATRNVAA